LNARDRSGNALQGGNTITFTTAAYTQSSPSLTDVMPNSASTNTIASGVSITGTDFRQGGISHTPGALPFGGHYYLFPMVPAQWWDAEDWCEARSGHLPCLSSTAEDDFVWQLGGRMNFWLGINDQAQEGVFAWVSGEPVIYTNWAPGEPNDWGDEYCSSYFYQFGWNDVGSDPPGSPGGRDFVCEYETLRGPDVKLTKSGQPDIMASNVQFLDGSHVTFDVDLNGAETGFWDVVLTNPDGAQSTLAGAFLITP
jgi:hypothetical protein